MPVLDIGGWRSDDEISKSVACAKGVISDVFS